MREAITFSDVLIIPKFSDVGSRKNVSLRSEKLGLDLPVISSNMTTVTGVEMACAMFKHGATACLHRFQSVEDEIFQVKDTYFKSIMTPMFSVGVGTGEFKRAESIIINTYAKQAKQIVIDVANGAQQTVVEQVNKLREAFGEDIHITVGNFASVEGVSEFLERCRNKVDAVKVGIGPSGVCTTRVKTGVGMSQLSAVMEISKLLKNTDIAIIADGGLRSSGDCAKALGAGAHALMIGGLFAGTDESPGEKLWLKPNGQYVDENYVYAKTIDIRGNTVLDKTGYVGYPVFKKYQGSASQASYDEQGKTGTHRTAEGESVMVPYKGPVANVLAEIEGGLRSAFTYVGARNLEEFQAKCEFVRVSPATAVENTAYAKTK